MRRKGSFLVDFIVKVVIHFTESDHIPSIIFFITFPRIWIIRISWVSSAPCSQLVDIMQRSQLSDCLCQLIDLLHLTFECLRSWVPIEVRIFCKTFVKSLNIALLFSMISPTARELGVEKWHWKNGKEDFLEFRRNSSAVMTHRFCN